MKKQLTILAMIISLVVGSTYSSRARAEVGTASIVFIVIGAISAVYTIVELATVGDEWSASTAEMSGRVHNKKQFLEEIQVGAYAYLAGEAPSFILEQTLLETRDRLGDDSADYSDEQLVWLTLDSVEMELSQL